MGKKSLKKDVIKWSQKIGHKNALRRLVCLGMSPSMAERLVRGVYSSDPHPDTAAQIVAEIKKDEGIPLVRDGMSESLNCE